MAKAAFVSEDFNGEVKTFDGKPLAEYGLKDKNGKVIEVLSYKSASNVYADSEAGLEAIKAAGLMPKRKDIVQSVNGKLRAKERARVIAAVYKEAGFEKPDADSNVAKWDNLYKAMIAAGREKDVATKMANMGMEMTREQAIEKDKQAAEESEESEEVSA